MDPPLGKLRTLTETVSALGGAPAATDPRRGLTVNQAPPSAVVGATVNFSVPVPPFATRSVCGVAFLPGWTEKLSPPGRLSKNEPEAAMAKVTGIVIERPGLAYSVRMISPV